MTANPNSKNRDRGNKHLHDDNVEKKIMDLSITSNNERNIKESEKYDEMNIDRRRTLFFEEIKKNIL